MPDDCINCGHTNGWHLYSDGPHARKCNFPGCKCDEYTKELPDA